jgi:hypothetical protein
LADFTHDLNINTVSLYAAVKEALAGFDKLPSSDSKTFLYTGNILNVSPAPMFTTLGVGKTASAFIIEVASGAYSRKGYKLVMPALSDPGFRTSDLLTLWQDSSTLTRGSPTGPRRAWLSMDQPMVSSSLLSSRRTATSRGMRLLWLARATRSFRDPSCEQVRG